MFNRARRQQTSSEPEPAEPTIAAIAGAVRQPAALQLALQTWRSLQERHSAVSSELRGKIAELQKVGSSGHAAPDLEKQIRALDLQARSHVDEVRGALADVVAARPAYIAAVASALAPARREAARRALAAAEALVFELDILGQIGAELRAIGGSPAQRAFPHHRSALASAVERLLQLAT
jgi:hypothetical protein